ncbi:MAG: hypothetical protein ACFFFC_04015 [Candidatus Thorarchaeota archaeon]
MVRIPKSLIDILNDWSDDRCEVDIYTGADELEYTGFIIHVGEDYLAMGKEEGKNVYDTLIPIRNITRIHILLEGTGVESWELPKD